MSLISTTATNLINGVSQQADELSFSSQAKEQINAISSVVDGLKKRPPMSHIKKLFASGVIGDDSFYHPIIRDSVERYEMVVEGDATTPVLSIFDLAGVASTVPVNAKEVTSITCVADVSDSLDGKYFLLYDDAGSVAFWIDTDNSGTTIPAGASAANRAVEITTIVTNDSASAVASAVNNWINSDSKFSAPAPVGAVITVTDATVGSRTDAADGDTGFTIATTTQGFNHLPYLQTTTPQTSLKAITVADNTIVVNLDKTPALKAATTTIRAPEAIVFVKQTRYGAKFKIKLWNDPTNTGSPDYEAHVTTQDNPTATTALENQGEIITNLEAQLDATAAGDSSNGQSGGNASTVYSYFTDGSQLYISKTDNSDFRIEIESVIPDGIFAFKDEVQNFSLLPNRSYAGFEIKVIGDPDNDGDDYYVKFVSNIPSQTNTFSEGSWQETVAQGVKHQFDETTMPHLLISTAPGVFTFGPATWTDMKVGDKTSNPDPSFIGKKIREVFFYKNRLGFCSDENVIMSEAGEFFNFWRTTIISLLDSDLIDVGTTHTKVSILNHAVALDERMTFWSDATQFADESDPLLTPKTVSIPQTTEYKNLVDTKPVVIGNSIFFGFSRGQFSGIQEYILRADTGKFAAGDISGHVPRYLKGNPTKITGSDTENFLAVITDTLNTGFYVYKWFDKGADRLQSSWSQWDTGIGTTVRDVFIIDTIVYVVVTRNDGTFLESIDIQDGLKDTNSDRVVYLDRRIKETDLSGLAYSAITGNTTASLPYAPNEVEQVQNKDFALGSGNTFTNWTLFTSTDNVIQETATGGVGGSRALQFVVNKNNQIAVVQTGTPLLDIGRKYKLTITAKSDAFTGNAPALLVSGTNTDSVATSIHTFIGDLTTSFKTFEVEFTAGVDYLTIRPDFNSNIVGRTLTIDDISVIPVGFSSEVVVVTRDTAGIPRGFQVPGVTFSSASLTIPGDYSSTPLWVGVTYRMRYDPNRPYVRNKDGSINNEGRLQVKHLWVGHDNTIIFNVESTNRGRSKFTSTYQNRDIGVNNAILGEPLPLKDGTFRMGIHARNLDTNVSIINDTPFPSNFTNLTWISNWNPKSTRI